MNKFSNIVILCVGTNNLIGDSIGPIVGQKLTRLLEDKKNIRVYGNRQQNLNIKNANQIVKNIKEKDEENFIITIDSALGPKDTIGEVWVTNGEIKIGEALANSIKYFSNINIKGVVGENRNNIKENLDILNKVERRDIHKLSNKITYEVYNMVEKINSV